MATATKARAVRRTNKSTRAKNVRKADKTVKKVSAKRVARIVLLAVLCAALAGGAVFAAWHFSDGFTHFPWSKQTPNTPGASDVPPEEDLPSVITPGIITGNYYIEIGGKQYGEGGIAPLSSGAEVTVSEAFGKDYTVKMTANGAKEFDFTLGAEPYTWHNVAGDDFTAGFTIARTDTGFTISYGDLVDIISKVKGNAVTIDEETLITVADKFTMTITAQNGKAISINFITVVNGVFIENDNIIFIGNTIDPHELSEAAIAYMNDLARTITDINIWYVPEVSYNQTQPIIQGLENTYAGLSDEDKKITCVIYAHYIQEDFQRVVEKHRYDYYTSDGKFFDDINPIYKMLNYLKRLYPELVYTKPTWVGSVVPV